MAAIYHSIVSTVLMKGVSVRSFFVALIAVTCTSVLWHRFNTTKKSFQYVEFKDVILSSRLYAFQKNNTNTV